MEAQEYSYVKREILKLTGVDLNCYKTPQVQRRLRTFLLRSGYNVWTDFFHALQDDADIDRASVTLANLKDYLTINVSSFFRDPDKFEYLRESILPELLRNRPRLHVWSAGCSHGHEPYTLAILLAEATGINCRHRILATDIDHSALERARAGGPYSAEEVGNLPPLLLSRYFEVYRDIDSRARSRSAASESSYRITQSLRNRITYRYHNLLADPFENGFDLIVCRNVVIYFTPEVKARLYDRFHQALRPGGVLFVGGTEFLSKASDIGFESAGMSFYRRIGDVPRSREYHVSPET